MHCIFGLASCEGMFLPHTFSCISPPILDTTRLLQQQLRLDNFSLFLICSRSLCNTTTCFFSVERKGWTGDKRSLLSELTAKPKAHAALIDSLLH